MTKFEPKHHAIRVDANLYASLVGVAEAERRSLTAQVSIILEKGLAALEAEKAPVASPFFPAGVR